MNSSKVIVSACLAGINCRYDCQNKLNQKIKKMLEDGEAIAVCPEQLGGLSTPRSPAENQSNKIINKNGEDVTAQYQKGAAEALKIAQSIGAKTAFLKTKSPMCGYQYIYDGGFNGALVEGHGVFAELLVKNNFNIISVD